MTRQTRLIIVLALNLLLVAGLIAVGLAAHSLGVLAEGGDYLADAGAIGVSLLAIGLSKRPPTPTRPHGYPRATTLAALVNSGWLLIVSLLIIAGDQRGGARVPYRGGEIEEILTAGGVVFGRGGERG